MDGLSLRPGLGGHQPVAQQISGHRFRFLAAVDQLNPALTGDIDDRSLAAAAGVDLRFQHGRLPAKVDEGIGGGLGRVGDVSAGHGNARFAENLLRLVFVDLHGRLIIGYPCTSCFSVTSGESRRYAQA